MSSCVDAEAVGRSGWEDEQIYFQPANNDWSCFKAKVRGRPRESGDGLLAGEEERLESCGISPAYVPTVFPPVAPMRSVLSPTPEKRVYRADWVVTAIAEATRQGGFIVSLSVIDTTWQRWATIDKEEPP
jgi:hypothetical protein